MENYPAPFSDKSRKKCVIGKEKENEAVKTLPLDDPNVATSKINMKRRALGERKSTNVIGAKVVEKLSNPFDRKASTQLRTSGPRLKVERHDVLLVGIKNKKSSLKPANKLQMTSTNSGGNSSDKTRHAQRRSVSFDTHVNEDVSGDDNVNGENNITPDQPYSSTLFAPRRILNNSSRCQIGDLESSAYWISQIHMAESAGKHFVSAELFQLALECKAEPFQSLLDELQAYASRHSFLLLEAAWKIVFHRFMPLTNESKYLNFENPFFEAENHGSSEAGKITDMENSCVTEIDSQDANFDGRDGKFSTNSYRISKTHAREESSVTENEDLHGDKDYDADLFQEYSIENSSENGPPEDHSPWLRKKIHSKSSTIHFKFTDIKASKDAPDSVKIRDQPETGNQACVASCPNENISGPITHQLRSEKGEVTKSEIPHGIRNRMQTHSQKRSRGDHSSKPSTLLSILPWSICAIEYLLAILWAFLLIMLLYFFLSVFVIK